MKLYAVDLFAGCGGLSEGFINSGFHIISQIEKEGFAVETLKTRHLYYMLKELNRDEIYIDYLLNNISKEEIYRKFPDIKKTIDDVVIQENIQKESIDKIFSRISSSLNSNKVPRLNVILGGPPCQPYSLIGRSRDPNRMKNDKRNFLYKYYLAILKTFQPDIFVYENVPGLFSARAEGIYIFKKIIEDFSSLNPSYNITPPFEKISESQKDYILDSADFKIPQHRKRLFLIGYKKSILKENQDIKNIFSNIQSKALENKFYKYLTVEDAISDLPVLLPGEGNNTFYKPYTESESKRKYQIEMRVDSPGVLNHFARSHMKADLQRYNFFIENSNNNKSVDLKYLIDKKPDLIPNHKHLDKFIDRFKVQLWSRPSSTITSHISKDGHYYIHPDITQCRSFTVREAARCQSFPDNFKFEGSRTQQFIQVGNAVPPRLAFYIANEIFKQLKIVHE